MLMDLSMNYLESWAADHEEAGPSEHCAAAILLLLEWGKGMSEQQACSFTITYANALIFFVLFL